MRTVLLVLLVAAVGAIYVRAHAQGDADSALATTAAPRQVQELYGWIPDPAALLHRAEALPGLGAILGHDDAPPPVQALPFADIGTPRQLASVRRDIRRDLDAVNALSDAGGGTPQAAARTLADVYSARVLAALGPAGRRAFAARVAGTSQVARHVRVLGYEGTMVSGRRAMAEVVYRVSVRAPSGHFLVRPPSRWTVTLARERGRWRFVRGFDSA
jgi:hypothetical protein